MAKRNINTIAFTALGTAHGEATASAALVKSPVDRRVAESRARGIKDSLALLFETLPAKANREYYAAVALRAANAVRVANGLDPLDGLLLTQGTASEKSEAPEPKEAPSTHTSTREAKPTGKKSAPKVDRYDIDEGDQCMGMTKSSNFTKRCGHWGINGTHFCLQHQGQVPDAEVVEAVSQPATSTREAKPTSKKSAEKLASKGRVEADTAKPSISTVPVEPVADDAETASESKTTRKSLHDRVAESVAAKAAGMTEAERAEAQAEADFLAEAKASNAEWMATQRKLDIAEDADEVGTSMAQAFAVEALRASDI